MTLRIHNAHRTGQHPPGTEPTPLDQGDVRRITNWISDCMYSDPDLPPYLLIEVGRCEVEISVPYDAFDAWVKELGGAAKQKREMTERATYRVAWIEEPNERVVLRAYESNLRRAW